MAKKSEYGQVRAALEKADLDESPMAALGRVIADELDRQADTGEGMNAALVGQYRETMGGLIDDDDGTDPIGDLLSEILDSEKSGKT